MKNVNSSEEADKLIILVVDDTPANIDVLENVLGTDYRVKAALNGEKALELANVHPQPDMILLDIMMPGMDGYDVISRLQSNPATGHIPVIFVTAKAEVADEEKGLSLGAIDYITKPISPPIVRARVKTHLALYNQNRELERKVKQRTQQLEESKLEILRCLARAAEFKDNETGMHVIRMSHYSRIIAESLNLRDDWVDMLFKAAPMHDIGKIGIPDHILLKPGRFEGGEWEIMKQHVTYGVAILGGHESDLLKMAKEIAECHHERYDGTGYPKGLVGEDIPLTGRIVAIADVFDAVTSERPYKKAWSIEKTLTLFENESGKHFDPDIVKILMKCLPEILEAKERYAETQVQWITPD